MKQQTENLQVLKDQFGRKHDYLRISLIEKCNLRCQYCMPEEGIPLTPSKFLMSANEIGSLAQTFVDMGVKKIRLTGGEPLLRKDFEDILANLSSLGVDLSITTNGILADRFLPIFQKYGLKKVNFSLDTLKEERFKEITRRSGYQKTMDNLDLFIKAGFDVKLNIVLMKDLNEDEVVDFVDFTKDLPISARFIEFMPFDGNKWDRSKLVSEKEILGAVGSEYGSENLLSLPDEDNMTARKFKIKGFQGDFGIISSVTNPFCGTCNRIRLTANGRIKNCLFSNQETDLLTALRAGEDVEKLILESIFKKKAVRAGMDNLEKLSDPNLHSDNRSMIAIGG
ncbi:GTP 3',8-cyclase MoaA [Algoriphagus zhangzhouensis]|uniref:GTP 3',8-cyclase n=1 Tax=Algoriphagus zhangzhouensis TaxID=1073327 RepID=A0A1M7ZAK9_9BACT|nr:GTP 3',8-cyclase MoaA [Algoriphagus zhangzhouensis]TDY47198.1 cyclic pyranopterin monophosphate synthase subunit MoaA [Algoriphagus zhangzhouensis]SHO61842.1 cyclic pyranopterin phosphate synthase [Algoriphagus zhangzhouensis]